MLDTAVWRTAQKVRAFANSVRVVGVMVARLAALSPSNARVKTKRQKPRKGVEKYSDRRTRTPMTTEQGAGRKRLTQTHERGVHAYPAKSHVMAMRWRVE